MYGCAFPVSFLFVLDDVQVLRQGDMGQRSLRAEVHAALIAEVLIALVT